MDNTHVNLRKQAFSVYNGISNLSKVQTTFLPNANIFIWLAKSIKSSSTTEKQLGMSMIPSFISDVLVQYGFKHLLYAALCFFTSSLYIFYEHVLGQGLVSVFTLAH